ncbi:unnamed protein product [Didymodactylos carnosus]|uniref:CBF1-interacting co-repressor CIR N-terminal domain-containing protein n=1 Tax=Didymodactylos carnosus TaxID=1234261 RepID=A0A814CZV2_9BILA|nr:unnamed protein product [Didymodactylos carnosus]CAF0959534.1 unnamed protein product [Didymodactylos carnosus]CAF3723464.1 unnamed protein product [Didymodactylos carnosus]CAF3732351.1 unnamed protein product [Didymodactylos carnosus]
MNILPKKRWHVRNKDNIARVLKDEKKAADEDQQRLKRKALAEQEARLNILRANRGDHLIQFTNSLNKNEHVNLFKLEEEGQKNGDSTNVEHEKEKKEETEKFEKNLGLLTYLGQSVVESGVPWYMEKRSDMNKRSNESSIAQREEKDRLRIKKQDPLNNMMKYVTELKRKQTDDESDSQIKQKKIVNNKKCATDTTSMSRIEQLRAERLKRETEEKTKTAAYLSKVFCADVPDKTPEQSIIVETDDRKRRYNSQFNPEACRQNQTKKNFYD